MLVACTAAGSAGQGLSASRNWTELADGSSAQDDANDQMDFQIDQAKIKLQQAYELAQQRHGIYSRRFGTTAEARNDVNVYRINTQAALSRNSK